MLPESGQAAHHQFMAGDVQPASTSVLNRNGPDAGTKWADITAERELRYSRS